MKADRAGTDESDDRLDRSAFVETLASILVEAVECDGQKVGHRATGIVAGLTGAWGTGKSTILNLLQRRLERDGTVIVVNFNPWLLRDRDVLLGEMFKALRARFLASDLENLRRIAADVDRYWKAVDVVGYTAALGADVMGSAGVATVGWSRVSKPLRNLFARNPIDLDAARKELEQTITDADVAVVVLIDELDRVEDDEVREVARLIKAVGDISSISYLVAYDPERVADALGRGEGNERRTSGEAYLEKIIQYPIPLRPLWNEDVSRLLDELLDGHAGGRFNAKDERRVAVYQAVVSAIDTPRELKRLTGAFDIFWRVGRGEICPTDILAYSWIATKHPAIRDRIAYNPDRVINDPATMEEHFRRMKEGKEIAKPSPTSRLEMAMAEKTETLLSKLFPSLNGANSRTDWSDHDRLFIRRNLERILYLGDPPGAISREAVFALWNADSVGSATIAIDAIDAAGKLPRLFDRIDDLIVDLPSEGDGYAFVALSQLWRRSADYAAQTGPMNVGSRDISDTIVRLGIRDKNASDRITAILEALIAAGDFAIAPGFMRHELFAHKLTTGAHSQRDPCLPLEIVEANWSREAQRYRNAILDGSLLRDWQTVEPVFALSNCGMWDDLLRQTLTKSLTDPKVLTVFAVETVPPGHVIDTASLELLFEGNSVLPALPAAEAAVQQSNAWALISLRRLGKVIKGQNLMYDHDDDPN